MILLMAHDIKKMWGDRLLLQIEDLKIYEGDRIGLVGLNGAGKSTLLDILAGKAMPDGGIVRHYGKVSYITQMGAYEEAAGWNFNLAAPQQEKIWGIKDIEWRTMSGGERTRLKIARSLVGNHSLLLADEPTSNLDLEGIELLEKQLLEFSGAMVLVSHDRALLDSVCSRIWELEEGVIAEYTGNYSHYLEEKAKKRARAQTDYEEYVKEKQQLEEAMHKREVQAQAVRKVPRNLGSSEAREGYLKVERVQKKLQTTAKSLETRINKLEVKEKPKELPGIRLEFPSHMELHGRTAVRGEGISKKAGERELFSDTGFNILVNSRVVLCGKNGSGKTTLLKMILAGESGIWQAARLKIGYFGQEFDNLELEKSMLDNVMAESIYPLHLVRTILARLLFRDEQVDKPVKVLSGGERVKAALAKILVSEFNMLILDEPTNYLDIPSMEALEDFLCQYPGTMLLVTHDRYLMNKVGTASLIIDRQKLISYPGSYEDYQMGKEKQTERNGEKADNAELLLRLENRQSEIISRLSVSASAEELKSLDEEYRKVLAEIKALKQLKK